MSSRGDRLPRPCAAGRALETASAVHSDHLAGDVGRIDGEKVRRAGDVLGRPGALQSGHITGPGAMPFTRTSGPSSRASDRVSITSPALAAEYTG